MQQHSNTPYPIGDTPGLELLSPEVAHTLRVAIADYRTPSAALALIRDQPRRVAGGGR